MGQVESKNKKDVSSSSTNSGGLVFFSAEDMNKLVESNKRGEIEVLEQRFDDFLEKHAENIRKRVCKIKNEYQFAIIIGSKCLTDNEIKAEFIRIIKEKLERNKWYLCLKRGSGRMYADRVFEVYLSGKKGNSSNVIANFVLDMSTIKKGYSSSFGNPMFYFTLDKVYLNKNCAVCDQRESDEVLNCGHVCLCGDCFSVIERNRYKDEAKCPICRSEIDYHFSGKEFVLDLVEKDD